MVVVSEATARVFNTMTLTSVEYGCKPRGRVVWSGPDYAPVLPMDHDDRVRNAGMAEKIDRERIESAGVNAHGQEGVPAADTILAKGAVGIELTGETESGAPAIMAFTTYWSPGPMMRQGTCQRRCHNTASAGPRRHRKGG